jgi:hypothetical protein
MGRTVHLQYKPYIMTAREDYVSVQPRQACTAVRHITLTGAPS